VKKERELKSGLVCALGVREFVNEEGRRGTCLVVESKSLEK
jgi:hypothetical protein